MLEIMKQLCNKVIKNIKSRVIIRTRPTDNRQTYKTLGPVMTILCSKFDGNCTLMH